MATTLTILFAVAWLALQFAGGRAALARPSAAGLATLTVLDETVQVIPAAGPARPGRYRPDLAEGDRLITGPAGRALVTFSDGSEAIVKPGTDLTLQTLQSAGDGSDARQLVLAAGTVVNRVAQLGAGDSYAVQVPSGVALVRGTVFTTSVARAPDTGQLQEEVVDVESGTVEMRLTANAPPPPSSAPVPAPGGSPPTPTEPGAPSAGSGSQVVTLQRGERLRILPAELPGGSSSPPSATPSPVTSGAQAEPPGPTLELQRSTNLVANGSFEQPAVHGFLATYAAGASDLSGWSVDEGAVDLSALIWAAATGAQSVDMNGPTGPGAISQVIQTRPGTTYALRFALAGNPQGEPAVKRLEVWWDGAVLDTVEFDTTGRATGDMGWTERTYTVTARDASVRLAFKSITDGANGPVLDDVSLTEQPAPAAG